MTSEPLLRVQRRLARRYQVLTYTPPALLGAAFGVSTFVHNTGGRIAAATLVVAWIVVEAYRTFLVEPAVDRFLDVGRRWASRKQLQNAARAGVLRGLLLGLERAAGVASAVDEGKEPDL